MTRIRRIARLVAALGVALATGCGGGGGGSSGGAEEEKLPPTYPGKKIVFVTSTMDDGNLLGWMPQCSGRSTGLEAADCICQQHAQLWGNLSGTYRAWLSDSKQSAASRLAHATVPYANRLGEVIAAGWAALASAPCSDLMSYDESGDLVSKGFGLVWTGSDAAGNLRGPTTRTCGDWTSGKSSSPGWVGSASVDSYWPNFPGCWSEWVEGGGWDDCDSWNRLYCFEQ